jgi:hypothetical protein
MDVAALGRSLAHRNYRLFLLGQGISLIGTWMQQVAMAWLLYRLTASARSVSNVIQGASAERRALM